MRLLSGGSTFRFVVQKLGYKYCFGTLCCPQTRLKCWWFFLDSEGKLSVVHSLTLVGKNSCQNFLVHPKFSQDVSTKSWCIFADLNLKTKVGNWSSWHPPEMRLWDFSKFELRNEHSKLVILKPPWKWDFGILANLNSETKLGSWSSWSPPPPPQKWDYGIPPPQEEKLEIGCQPPPPCYSHLPSPRQFGFWAELDLRKLIFDPRRSIFWFKIFGNK